MNCNMTLNYITESHKRCLKYGIKKDMLYSKKIIEGEELQNRLAEKNELIVTSEPFINEMYNFVKGSNFFVILTDEEGCILNVVGDEEILKEAYAFKMIPGAFMDEASIGTNAMGTVLEEKKPLQITGNEHFINCYHRWTCSGAVIKDPDGKIIGALDLTGYSENVHSHTLGMVVSAVNAIEKTLKLNRSNEVLKNNAKFIETLMDSINAGIISCDLSGDIKTLNKHAYQMFGYSKNEMKEINISNIFSKWMEVKLICQSKKEFQNEDVLINSRTNKLYFNLSAYPIVGDDEKVLAIILVFKDVKKVRKLANEIMGRRAIYTFDKIIGKSEKLLEAIDFAKKVADSKSTILLTGESGTGKEIFAHAIQNHSSRKDENFVVVNCASIPRNLIESELFGYEEGSFTGAKRGGQPGKFEIADGGTIFLDEIGEMCLDMQTRLLRVIQEGVINRIGSNNEIPVDVRIIAATNKNLKEEVDKGNFRMDLYYRLNVLPVKLPPLRERKEDIPYLIDYFTKKISKKINKKAVNISREYIDILVNYDWLGNIRELENLIELIINTEKIPITLNTNDTPHMIKNVNKKTTLLTLEELEERYIKEILHKNKYNITLSAKILGVGRNTLYRKITKYNIECSQLEHCTIIEQ